MHTNSRSQWPRMTLAVFVLLTGMSCSLFSSGAGNSRPEEEQVPPPIPTTEGVSQDELPIPLVPDAANFESSQASFSYTTQLSVEEVARFYQEKLPPAGWTIEQGNMGTTLMWTLSRQDVKYLLTIMPSNGMTVVNAGQLR